MQTSMKRGGVSWGFSFFVLCVRVIREEDDRIGDRKDENGRVFST